MKVVWSVDAKASYEQNISYLTAEWSDAVIANFIHETEIAVASIQKNPALYPFHDRRKEIRRCIVVKQITLYYKASKTDIELLLFWNNHQNPKKLKLK